MAIVKVCPDVKSFTVDFKGPVRFFRNITNRRRGGLNGRTTYWRNTRTESHIQWTVDAGKDTFGIETIYDAPFGTGEGENGVTMTITP